MLTEPAVRDMGRRRPTARTTSRRSTTYTPMRASPAAIAASRGPSLIPRPSPPERERDQRAEREQRGEQERPAESFGDASLELVLEAKLERGVLRGIGTVLKGDADVGQLACRGGDLREHVLGEADLLGRRDGGVEDLRRSRLEGVLLSLVERMGEHGRQQDEPYDDAGVAGGDRPAAMNRLGRATLERALGERRESEAEPDPDQHLRRDDPPPAGAGKYREGTEPSRYQHRPGDCSTEAFPTRGASRRPATAAAGITLTTRAAAIGDSLQPSTSNSTSRKSAAVSAPERSSSAMFGGIDGRPAGAD